MYGKEELPTLIEQLSSTTDEAEIKKCCLSAGAIAQELIVKSETEFNDDVPELLDDTLLQLLINVIKDSTEKPKVAVRNVFRALGDISKMTQAKDKLKSMGIFEAVAAFLDRVADNGRQTITKEVFSFAACAMMKNLADAAAYQTLISLNYIPLLCRLLRSSISHRPAASVFAGSLLWKLVSTDEGRADFMNKEGYNTLKTSFERTISSIEGENPDKDELLVVLKLVSLIVATVCENLDNVPIFAQGGFVMPLATAVRLLGGDTTSSSVPSDATAPGSAPLYALFQFLKTEDGGEEVNAGVDLSTMHALLKFALTIDPDKPDTSKALTKLALGIGGAFTGEPDIPVTAADFVAQLNHVCRVFCQRDAEVIFIITSLIVHLSSFDNCAESLQNDDTISTSAEILTYYLQQEKSEVTQSILRNECVMLSTACSTESVIPLMTKHGIFPLLREICGMHAELNSEITETTVILLHRVSTSEDGVKEVGKVTFKSTFRDVLEYFTNVNLTDERRESIIATVKQLTESLPSN